MSLTRLRPHTPTPTYRSSFIPHVYLQGLSKNRVFDVRVDRKTVKDIRPSFASSSSASKDATADDKVLEMKSDTTVESRVGSGLQQATPPKPVDELEENDTFLLAKDSLLFSQISKNEIHPSEGAYVPVGGSLATECRVVEIKERQLTVPTSEPVIKWDADVQYYPHSVEIVEIVETDPDTDDQEPVAEAEPMEVKTESASRKRPVEKTANEGSLSKKTCVVVATHPATEPQDVSILLEVTDRINRTEEAKVTASCSASNVYDLDTKQTISDSTLKEVKLKREVQVSRTYQIVGNFERSMVASTQPTNGLVGGQRDQEEAVTSSDDEARRDEESSSSGDFSICDAPPDLRPIEVGAPPLTSNFVCTFNLSCRNAMKMHQC